MSFDIFGQRERQHLGRCLLDLRALLGVVVDEDEAVEAESEFLGKLREVLGLGIPVQRHATKCRKLQRHLRMRRERLEHVLSLFLLAMVSSMPASRCSSMHSCSARRGGIEDNAFGSILAADALPQRVVAIERDDLERRPEQRMSIRTKHRPQRAVVQVGVRNLSQTLALRIVDGGQRDIAARCRSSQCSVRRVSPDRAQRRFSPAFSWQMSSSNERDERQNRTRRIQSRPGAAHLLNERLTLASIFDSAAASSAGTGRSPQAAQAGC